MSRKNTDNDKKTVINLDTIPTLPEGIHRYERGLYVRVTKTSRFWLLKYTCNGKRREMGLGPALDQPLDAVRAKANRYRVMIDDGVDPLDVLAEKKEQQKKEDKKTKMPTFAEYAPKALDRILFVRQFRGKNTEGGWRRTIAFLSDGPLGKRRLDSITKDDIAIVIQPVWVSKPRTGRDLLNRLNGIFNMAKSEGLVEKNPAEWVGGLDALLPSLGKVRSILVPEKHHAALSAEDLRSVVQELWKMDKVTAMGAVFGALTAGRANEFLAGRWDEIDLKEKTFSVPKERRKDGKDQPHVVPLSRQAQALIRRLDTSSDFLFSYTNNKPICNTAVLKVLKAVTDKPVTIHGMRSTFSDWCAKNGKNFLVSERCLMHAVGNTVFRAYQRDDLLDQRRVLMQEWADFLLPGVE